MAWGGGWARAFVPLLGPTICVKPLHKRSQLQRPPCHHDPDNGSRGPLQSQDIVVPLLVDMCVSTQVSSQM